MTKAKRNPDRDAEMIRLRQAGLSYSAIGRLFDIGRTTVRYATDPVYAATRREQMRFYIYLRNIPAHELEAAE